MHSLKDDTLILESSPIIGGGEMGDRIRSFNWSESLGPIDTWPLSLVTAVNIVLQSPVPLVMLWGKDGIMIYNNAYSIFAGARHPFLLGSKVVEGWPEVADFNRNVMDKGLKGETLSYSDQRLTLYRNNVAEDVWMDLNYSPIIDENGKPGGVLAVVTETTQRVVAKQALRESEERFRTMADAAPVMIWTSDKNGNETYFNKTWLEFTGRILELEMTGAWRHYIHPDDAEQTNFICSTAKQRQEGFTLEFRFQRHDGEYRWILDTATPRFNESGELVGYIGSCIDITEIREASNEMKLAKETAEEANHRKDQFISTMSHELRTPLNAIIGYSDMLLNGYGGPLNEKQLKYTKNVATSGRHLLDMVNEILDLAKIESGTTDLKLETVNLSELMQEKQRMFEVIAQQKNVSIIVDLDEKLPEITADNQRLRQILLNLLSNAIKFNKHSGVVWVRWFQEDQWAVCEVEDTGHGIPEDKIPNLFNEFYQVDNSFARKHEGTGLGLAVTKRLVELHGGTISVTSQEDIGSTFTFKLPLNFI